MLRVDCLIIGAGPTGLTLGIGLVRSGKTVLIAEKHTAGLGFSKAILVSSDSLKALKEYEVTQRIQNSGSPLDGVSFFVDERLTSSAQFDTSFPDNPIVLPQEATEKCLKDVYLELGGQLMLGITFDPDENTSVHTAGLPMVVKLRGPAKELTTVECTYLFGCDGVHSSVRKSLNIEFPGRAVPEQVNYVFDVEAEFWPFETLLTMWFASADSGLMLKISSSPMLVRIVGTTQASAQRLLQRLRVRKVLWESTYTSSYRLAESYGRGNVWLAGDACHAHSPLGGRGMNTGIADAICLAEAVNTGDFAGYQATCRPRIRWWVYFNYFLSMVSMSQSPGFYTIRSVVSFVLRGLAYVMGPTFSTVAFQMMTTSIVRMKLPNTPHGAPTKKSQ